MKIRTARRQFDYDLTYMSMAEAMARLSYAKRSQVGAIIVSPNDQVIAQGYNGTPNGWDNCCEFCDEHENLHTKPEVLHAESNAIAKCAMSSNSTLGATLYVTMSPCFDCAKLIVQSGIKRVVFKELYRIVDGIAMMLKSDVVVEQINEFGKCWTYRLKDDKHIEKISGCAIEETIVL